MAKKEDITIAEAYAQKMPVADDKPMFEVYTKRYEHTYPEVSEPEMFARHVTAMHERSDANRGYEFPGTIRNTTIT